MLYFKDDSAFDQEMHKFLNILKKRGLVIEADHPYAYAMQQGRAFSDVSDWLEQHGYHGHLNTMGHFNESAGAVYGLYDEDRVSYEEMREILVNEGVRQAMREFE